MFWDAERVHGMVSGQPDSSRGPRKVPFWPADPCIETHRPALCWPRTVVPGGGGYPGGGAGYRVRGTVVGTRYWVLGTGPGHLGCPGLVSLGLALLGLVPTGLGHHWPWSPLALVTLALVTLAMALWSPWPWHSGHPGHASQASQTAQPCLPWLRVLDGQGIRSDTALDPVHYFPYCWFKLT